MIARSAQSSAKEAVDAWAVRAGTSSPCENPVAVRLPSDREFYTSLGEVTRMALRTAVRDLMG